MCRFALVGAATNASELRGILGDGDGEWDTDVLPDPRAARWLPSTDSVLCVTSRGCSCPLLEGLGVGPLPPREVHLAGPSYLFRRALATATLRFGGIRVLAYDRATLVSADEPPRRRTTTLGQFLRSGLELGDSLLCVLA